jgi:glycerol-3-phosphate dehydrogenase
MKRAIAPLTEETFDLVILGGGITGAGVALDAALRGLRVALIDKGDFASGTSSVSSKLIHCGLRYLETGHLQLVYEALHERGLLLRNAPHLVWPLRFLFPFYEGTRVRPWQGRLGLTLYDLLAGHGNLHRSRPLSSLALARECPCLRQQGLRGGAEFFDAQMDDARLCLEVMRTAAAAGACVCNYVEARGFRTSRGQINTVEAVDRVVGAQLLLRARQVLNATGPWVDDVCRLAGDPSGPKLQPTKGVHLIAPGRGLPAAFLLLHPEDGRVFFVIPWLGKTLLGTTDTFAKESPDSLTVTPEDTRYLLTGFNHYFDPSLRPEDIRGSFAGLRPLLRSGRGTPSARSREFRMFTGPSGLLSVAGGKYTTYRKMAEVITTKVLRCLGRCAWCRTEHYLLDGTPREAWADFAPAAATRLEKRYHLEPQAARHLVQRYGRRADAVAGYLESAPELAGPLAAGEPDIRAELAYQRDHEMAVYPEDHLLRRTRLGLFCPELLSTQRKQV